MYFCFPHSNNHNDKHKHCISDKSGCDIDKSGCYISNDENNIDILFSCLAPYWQKRKCYNVVSLGCIGVFVDKGLKYTVPKLSINKCFLNFI